MQEQRKFRARQGLVPGFLFTQFSLGTLYYYYYRRREEEEEEEEILFGKKRISQSRYRHTLYIRKIDKKLQLYN